MMMLSSTSSQQNMGSNANHSPSVPRINPSQQYNSWRSPTIYGHSQLPFNHPLQHQQQQQQQLGGLTRSAMMGQGKGPGHISMLSGPGQISTFQSQFLPQQVRQKQPQIQSSQFPQLVSSGQPLQGMQTIGLMSLGTGTQNRMNGSTLVYSQQRIPQGPLRSPPTPQQQALSSPQVNPTIKLDPDVIDVFLELAEDYYQSAEINAIAYAKHRKSTVVEEKDMLLHLKKNCHLSIPGYTTREFNKNKRTSSNEAHIERLAKVQKSMAVPQVESEAVVNNGASGLLMGSSNSGVQVAKALQNSVPIVASSVGSTGVQKKS